MQAHTYTEFCCCCFIPNCLNAGAFLVLRQVHSRVSVRVRASTADGLIKEPDQAKGFVENGKPVGFQMTWDGMYRLTDRPCASRL